MKPSILRFSGQLVFLVMLTMIMACTPETRYKVLSTIFDGVPPPKSPYQNLEDTTAQNLTKAQKKALELRKRTQVVYTFHPPYREKDCGSCHEVGSGNRLNEPMPTLCYNCHDDFSESYAVLHGPVASGNCTGCHNPHMSKNKNLLKRTKQDLCLYCHDKKRLAQLPMHRDKMTLDCQVCHDPHGGSNKFYLTQK